MRKYQALSGENITQFKEKIQQTVRNIANFQEHCNLSESINAVRNITNCQERVQRNVRRNHCKLSETLQLSQILNTVRSISNYQEPWKLQRSLETIRNIENHQVRTLHTVRRIHWILSKGNITNSQEKTARNHYILSEVDIAYSQGKTLHYIRRKYCILQGTLQTVRNIKNCQEYRKLPETLHTNMRKHCKLS